MNICIPIYIYVYFGQGISPQNWTQKKVKKSVSFGKILVLQKNNHGTVIFKVKWFQITRNLPAWHGT